MMSNALRRFVEDILDKRRIDDEDVKILQRDILPDGAMSREDIDMLVALDRAISEKSASYADLLVALAVEFAVWTCRPTGHVNRDTAHWLVSSLETGEGPTPTSVRLAFEVVREAESCDESLLSFTMRHGGANGEARATGVRRATLVS